MGKKRRLKKETLHAVVAPKKKEVQIKLGRKVLKIYRFKMDVPSRMVKKEVHGYDYGAWSVSDRDFTYTVDALEWDEEIMKDIRIKALDHYKSTLPSPL